MKIVAYYRVSSREQKEEGYSIEAQQKLVQLHAERRGFEIVKEFVEIETAKKTGRKVFTEMLGFIKDSSEIQGILCHKVDRLSRNFRDVIIIDDLTNKVNDKVKPLFVEDDFPENASGKMTFGMKVVLAKYYSDNLSDEVKKGMREKVEQGGYPHKPPFGYAIDASTMPHRIIPDPQASVAVQKAFEWYATSAYSIKQLRDKLIEEGLAKKHNGGVLGKGDIGNMLGKPFYYGWFKWKELLWDSKGSYQPLVSKDLWDKAQWVLDEQNKPRVRKHNFNFTMLMKCGECGYSVTAERKIKYYKTTDRTATYVYYRCTKPKSSPIKCSQKPITEDKLTKQLVGIIDAVGIDDKVLSLLKNILKESHTEEEEYHLNSIKSLREQQDALQNKLDRLLDGYLDGAVSKEIYDGKNRQLQQDKDNALRQLQRHEEGNKEYFEQIENFIELCHQAPALFRSSSPQLKRELLKFVVSDLILIDEIVRPNYKIPFSLILKTKENGNWSGREDLNLRPLAPKASALNP